MTDKDTRVGFTGTRDGMTDDQARALRGILRLLGTSVLHHGDCIGADTEAHSIAEDLGIVTVIHPPTEDRFRGFNIGSDRMKREPYLKRNRNIVDACGILIAAPKKNKTSGGTWYTVNYAEERSIKTIIIHWNGYVEERTYDQNT